MKPDIKAIEARAAAATPGPWEASKDGWTAWAGNVKIADYLDPDNAEFIAHARTDIPRLLDYIKELEAENEKLEIMLYMIVRMKVMAVGLEIGKSEDEINLMAYTSMKAMEELIDWEKGAELLKNVATTCNNLQSDCNTPPKKEHVREMQKNADFIANAREDLPWALDVIAAQQLEIDRLTEALEIAKRGHVDCMSAERQADGKCLGYGRGENDDEPCAQCSNCPQCTAYEPERKPINEWAALDGICVLDPDGFDRSDPYVLEREITKAEYLAGIWRCTVMPLPAAPEEGE